MRLHDSDAQSGEGIDYERDELELKFGFIFLKNSEEGVKGDEEDDETEGEYYVLTIG